MDINPQINKAIVIGKHNQEIENLLHAWCSHIRVEPWAGGGVGLVEEMTGLPIGMRHVRCNFAKKSQNMFGMNLEPSALWFYENNCVGCPQRKGVRLPNISTLFEKYKVEQKEEEKKQEIAKKTLRMLSDSEKINVQPIEILRIQCGRQSLI